MSDKIKLIGPEQFFDIEHPGNPYVEIQFRTSQLSDPNNINSATWESITLENNFFDQLTITDESGFQNMELILKDRDFINIEDVVLRTVMNSRVESWAGMMNVQNKKTYDAQTTSLNAVAIGYDELEKMSEDERNKKATEISDTVMKNTFQFYIDNSAASCIRVRFGWASNKKGYYDVEDTKDFLERTKNTSPVIRSPWLYFMMLGANYNINSEGMMSFLIKGITVSKAYLENAKFLMNGTVLQDKAEVMWKELHDRIYEASGETVVLRTPTDDFFKYQDKTIKLTSLYETPSVYLDNSGNEKRSLHFKSLRQLISDFINLLNSKYVNYNGEAIEVKEGQEVDMSQVHHIEKPDFYITEEMKNGDGSIKGGKKQTVVNLYYRKPDPQEQGLIRLYSWKDAKNSIIKNFSVSTESDFAQMNAPITLKDDMGNLHQININSLSAGKDGMDLHLNFVSDLKDELNNMKGKSGFITTNVFKDSNMGKADNFLTSFIQNLNDNVFKGTIEIPLDPFYLFDNALKPYQYLIGIDVNTPSRYLRNGIYVSGRKSYLSGYYMIEKIRHSITASGATTSLDIVKFPEPRTTEKTFTERLTMEQKNQMLKTSQQELDRMDADAAEKEWEYQRLKQERNTLLSTSDINSKAVQEQLAGLNSRMTTLDNALEEYYKKRPELTSAIASMKL